MDATVHQFPPYRKEDAHHEDHAHEHHQPDFWSGYIFSTDHKIIGIQYGFTALCFLLFGFFLMLMMRWQIAHPGTPVPVIGPLLEKALGQVAAKGVISPELYNSFGAMHGTIMVFL
ncbi:MAG TPA: cytochrome C oxidase subunit I, partial [Candidatus Dormibacteraeota bacterium]|nr:cytochrome C oxidase subunit I [Candidatus Dormibacteraeota bacterium]